jgi:hypothetical protein
MAETPTQGAAPATGAKKVTRTEAVRLAMKELGIEGKRDQIASFVKSNFGYEMTVDQVSFFKSELAKKAKKAKAATAAKKPAAPKPAPAPQATPAKAPAQQKAPAATAGNNGRAKTVALDDVLTVKGLVDRVGADGLRELIAAFER